jgi:RNA polymerase sigma-70 factor (ECF subfamily)
MNDSPTIEQLVRKHTSALVLFARQWHHEEAEDIVQEAFIKLMRQRSLPDNPAAWLFTVVRNDSNNYIRSQKRRKKRELNAQSQKPALFEMPEDDEMETLIHTLESLELEEREIIVAKIWGELSFEKIAEMIGSSSSTVHRKYHEGLKRLEQRAVSSE